MLCTVPACASCPRPGVFLCAWCHACGLAWACEARPQTCLLPRCASLRKWSIITSLSPMYPAHSVCRWQAAHGVCRIHLFHPNSFTHISHRSVGRGCKLLVGLANPSNAYARLADSRRDRSPTRTWVCSTHPTRGAHAALCAFYPLYPPPSRRTKTRQSGSASLPIISTARVRENVTSDPGMLSVCRLLGGWRAHACVGTCGRTERMRHGHTSSAVARGLPPRTQSGGFFSDL